LTAIKRTSGSSSTMRMAGCCRAVSHAIHRLTNTFRTNSLADGNVSATGVVPKSIGYPPDIWFWPLAETPVVANNVRFRRQSGRQELGRSRQLLTRSGHRALKIATRGRPIVKTVTIKADEIKQAEVSPVGGRYQNFRTASFASPLVGRRGDDLLWPNITPKYELKKQPPKLARALRAIRSAMS
jgi:hypothetical protein